MSQLEDFVIERKLECRGFAHVYLARHRLDQQLYAVKIIRIVADGCPSRARASQEAQIMAKLSHYNVVRYHGAWLESGLGNYCKFSNQEEDEASDSTHAFLCIMLEPCHRTLKDVLNSVEYPKEKEKSMKYFRQLVCAVEYLHKKGVVHRDLNPANVFIDSSDNIKLGEFGLATSGALEELDDKDVEPFDNLGTQLYKAPELQQHNKSTNEKVDIFSLGLIWYELCHPFSTDSERRDVLGKLRKGELDPGSPLLKELIASDPSERPPANEIKKRLELLV